MKNKGIVILVVILVILIIGCGGFLIYKILKEGESLQNNSNNTLATNETEQNNDETLVIEQKEPEIFKGDERPIAVMIDNHTGAWPQANLNKAYLVYEIIVEGGETRLMALFKNQDLDEIGPVRSSRHYFLDYALENDAIYVHHGWSPQAQRDIQSLGIDYINGIQESAKDFWRVKDKSAPHNLFTSTESILKIAERKGYKTTSNKKSVLNYIAGDVELNVKYGTIETETEVVTENTTEQVIEETIANNTENTQSTNTKEMAIKASTVTIPHSSLQKVEYVYDEETKTYVRYARNKVQTDYVSGENITTKNIIITKCDNYTLNDTENKGRQGLDNIGTFDGYYITNGYAIPIQCTKVARASQTIYKDLEGNTIEVSDGNTFIQICPKDAEIIIE